MVDPNKLGEFPPNIEIVPGSVQIDGVPSAKNLLDRGINRANHHESGRQSLLEKARETGKDIIARVSPYGTELIIGVGVAAILGAIIVYQHGKKDKAREVFRS